MFGYLAIGTNYGFNEVRGIVKFCNIVAIFFWFFYRQNTLNMILIITVSHHENEGFIVRVCMALENCIATQVGNYGQEEIDKQSKCYFGSL